MGELNCYLLFLHFPAILKDLFQLNERIIQCIFSIKIKIEIITIEGFLNDL